MTIGFPHVVVIAFFWFHAFVCRNAETPRRRVSMRRQCRVSNRWDLIQGAAGGSTTRPQPPILRGIMTRNSESAHQDTLQESYGRRNFLLRYGSGQLDHPSRKRCSGIGTRTRRFARTSRASPHRILSSRHGEFDVSIPQSASSVRSRTLRTLLSKRSFWIIQPTFPFRASFRTSLNRLRRCFVHFGLSDSGKQGSPSLGIELDAGEFCGR